MSESDEQPPMRFRGYPADVVIEIQMRHGTLRVKVGDLAKYTPEEQFGVLHLPVGAPLQQRLSEAISEAMIEFGP